MAQYDTGESDGYNEVSRSETAIPFYFSLPVAAVWNSASSQAVWNSALLEVFTITGLLTKHT